MPPASAPRIAVWVIALRVSASLYCTLQEFCQAVSAENAMDEHQVQLLTENSTPCNPYAVIRVLGILASLSRFIIAFTAWISLVMALSAGASLAALCRSRSASSVWPMPLCAMPRLNSALILSLSSWSTCREIHFSGY